MPANQATRRAAALATVTAAFAFGTFVSSSAQAAAPSAAPPARAATSGIPALVDPAADLGRHAAGPQLTWFDSIYFTSSVRANGREFGLQVKLDIKAPGLSWTGDSVRQSVRVETPWGSLDVQLVPTGPAMNYASTGVFNLADGVPNYEFALPEVRTSGTLVVDGKKHQVGGTSWLDRQWVRCRCRSPGGRG